MSVTERQVKCPACGKLNQKSETTFLKKRYYCPPCADKKMEPKPKTAWDELFAYLQQLYGHPPTGQMYQQLKQYRQEYGYTDAGMYYSLKYYYETVKAPLHPEKGLGIIPYIYEEAKQHYQWLGHLNGLVQAFDFTPQELVVKGKVSSPKPSTTFDFDAIDWSETEGGSWDDIK